VVGHEHVVEEHLGETFVAVEALHAAHRDAGRGQVDEEVGEAVMAFGVGITSEQPEQVGAERAPGRPGLLSGQPPAAGRVVAHRLALDPREIAPGVGLRPTLAPGLLAGRHLREDARLLLGRSELEDRLREQEDAVLRHSLRRARAVVLLLEDQPLPQAGVATAERFRPRDHREAGVE